MALTDAKIRAAKPDEKPYKLADSGNMFLLVHLTARATGGSAIGFWAKRKRSLWASILKSRYQKQGKNAMRRES
jgi:hypothetical protein